MEKGEVEIRKQNRLSVKAKQARIDRIHRTRGTRVQISNTCVRTVSTNFAGEISAR